MESHTAQLLQYFVANMILDSNYMYVFTITLCTFLYTMYGCGLAPLCTRLLVEERLRAHLYVANFYLTAAVVTSCSNKTIIPSRKKFRY